MPGYSYTGPIENWFGGAGFNLSIRFIFFISVSQANDKLRGGKRPVA